MQLALPLDFTRPLQPFTMPKPNRPRREVATSYPPVQMPPTAYAENPAEILTCGGCAFTLRIGIDEAARTAGQTICLDCYERQQGIEQFTAREHLQTTENGWRHIYI